MTGHVMPLRRGKGLLQRHTTDSLQAASSATSTAVLLMAAAAAVGMGYPSPGWAAERAANTSSDMSVSVVPAKNMCFADTLQVTGVLVPRNEILVRPEREGLQISQVLVEPGDTVVSGQVLARLTPPEGQEGA